MFGVGGFDTGVSDKEIEPRKNLAAGSVPDQRDKEQLDGKADILALIDC